MKLFPDAPLAPQVGPGETLHPWERQPGEPSGAYHAFCHYRDQPRIHSHLVGWRNHKAQCEGCQPDDPLVAGRKFAPKRWHTWSGTWGWVERAAAWDAEMDRQAREVWSEEQLLARKRHAKLAHETLAVLALPVQAALDAAKSPDLITKLTQDATTVEGVHTLLAVIARMAQVIPAMVTMERLALGLTTEQVALEDSRDRAFADKIVTDPEATALAVQLLDRVTQAVQPVLPAHEDVPELVPALTLVSGNGDGEPDADG